MAFSLWVCRVRFSGAVGCARRSASRLAPQIEIDGGSELALEARDETNGFFGMFDDERILEAQRILAGEVGVFVEPASAISVAGLLDQAERGNIPAGSVVTLTVTGHGLKDPQWALKAADGSDVTPESVDFDVVTVAGALGLS